MDTSRKATVAEAIDGAAAAAATEDNPRSLLLRPGETCWRTARADRLALIVDAAEYFAVVKAAVLKARRSIMLIAWDFDIRIQLDPDGKVAAGPAAEGEAPPDKLGEFIRWIARTRPDLRIYILKWNLDVLKSLLRGPASLLVFDWTTPSRVRIELDGRHPPGACHHQKIIVIDDAIAFCGGIDMTLDRWDTRAHKDDDPHRQRPDGSRYGAWHDATTAVDGEAARALGELARMRWKFATGEQLPPPPDAHPESDPWPDRLKPSIRDVEIAIARTAPKFEEQPQTREIEALYLAAIGAARRTIYLESQYFASRRIAEAIVRRLKEEDGPEIVVVNPLSAEGWLEEEAMGSARALLLNMIREADRHRRFAIYTPQTAGGEPIYVHAKVMVIDDRLLRVGSSNLNNRSLGFDTECDLALDAAAQGDGRAAELARTIAGFRDDLLAEHLGVRPEEVAAALDATAGSLIGAIERLRRPEGRTLVPFVVPHVDDAEDYLAEHELLDPERPESLWHRLHAKAHYAAHAMGLPYRR
ncbi:MAG TPA: phospholipase D-like domain-containing protein [Stellaceae bacterium]